MEPSELEAVVRSQGAVAVIELRGEINKAAEASLNAAVEEAKAMNPSALLLNFADVEYINSTGIALIVGVLAAARKEKMAVSACGLSDHYTSIFEITRLVDFMQIFPDEDAAVAAIPATA